MTPVLSTLGLPSGVAGWDMLRSKTASDFPALANDPIVKSQIAYFEANAPKATTAQALLSDPRLQDFVLTAYGMQSENGMTALMEKVLNSKPGDPKSFAAQMVNTRYTKIASDFNYGGPSTPAQAAVPSSAEVAIGNLFQQSNFAAFSGTFGGVSVSNVDLSGVSTYQGLASALQAAFRQADGGRSNISVTLDGTSLKFSDALGRGTASGFTWTANAANQTAFGNPTAGSPGNLVSGAAAVPAQGGPAVTNSAFIQQVVQKYLEAQLEAVAGNQSNTLREARYAQQQLPGITDWNSVIADPALANVVQTVLGLPPSFGALNITQQAQVYGQRLNIKDFQNPTKLNQLLEQFVALGSVQATTGASASVAVNLLNTTATANGIINLTLPTATDSLAGASASAMLLSTAG
jgi:hypothetical protein